MLGEKEVVAKVACDVQNIPDDKYEDRVAKKRRMDA